MCTECSSSIKALTLSTLYSGERRCHDISVITLASKMLQPQPRTRENCFSEFLKAAVQQLQLTSGRGQKIARLFWRNGTLFNSKQNKL